MGYSFQLVTRDILYAPSHRQDSTYHDLCITSCSGLARMRKCSMGPLLTERDILYASSYRQDNTYHSLRYTVVEHWLEQISRKLIHCFSHFINTSSNKYKFTEMTNQSQHTIVSSTMGWVYNNCSTPAWWAVTGIIQRSCNNEVKSQCIQKRICFV